MFRLLIDTCVWIDVAKDAKQEHLLTATVEMVRRGRLSLIVPRIVLDELQRNRERIARDSAKSIASHIRVVRAAIERFADNEKRKQALVSELDQFATVIPAGSTADTTIGRIEKLLLASEIREASHAVLVAAAHRALEKRAPFHRDKNSMADAVLIEIYADCLRNEHAPTVQFAFVTHNTADFSREQGNDKEPHPDLAAIFTTGSSRFFTNLREALQAIDVSIVSAVRADEPTVGDLIRRHLKERPSRPFGPSHESTLKKLLRSPIAEKFASGLRVGDVLEHCRMRIRAGISPTTVRLDLLYLGGALRRAKNDWHINVSTDPVDEARSISLKQYGNTKEERSRRPTADEYKKLIKFFEQQNKSKRTTIDMTEVMEFAVYSARRRSEICELLWADVDWNARTCVVRNMAAPRHDLRRDHVFPLLGKAWEIVERRAKSKTGERIFPYDSKSIGKRFIDAKHRLRIRGLVFDDLRKEAATRLLEDGVPVHEVVRLTGHKHVDPLMRRYEQIRGTNPVARADDTSAVDGPH